MNAGLVHKALRESWLGIALFALGLGVFHFAMSLVLPTFFDDVAAPIVEHPFMRGVFRALMGDAADQIGPEVVASMPWLQPVVLSLLWAHAIMFCTRVPAAEVDRGTIDVVLALPVSRWQLYLNESIIWLLAGVLLVAAQVAGAMLGGTLQSSSNAPATSALAIIATNQLVLYLAVGGLAYFVSALSERRGRAIATVFTVVLASYFWQVLGQFWQPAERLGFLSPMHFYRPYEVVLGHGWPVRDLAVLGLAATALWVAGGLAFARRDLRTT